MKVYIPFNSNDFNSVFTTLSISPCSYYPNRKYSFKRASTSIINENEDFLIGFNQPIFHNRELDNDYGFPVLLETNIEITEQEFAEANSVLKYIPIEKTIFLTNDFKLLFRSEKEMNETFAKSLKSIETKYASLAKINSRVLKQDFYVSDLPKLKFPNQNLTLNSNTFKRERKLNKILGTVLGSSIAYVNSTTKEWQEITNLIRFLNNTLSLYLNKIGDRNDFEKTQSLEIISKISRLFESIEKLEEAIMLDSNITSDILNSLKGFKIFDVPVFNLLIEGLLASSKIELPISLKLEKLIRAINSKYNSKYPHNYIDKVNSAFNDLKDSVEKEIFLSRQNNVISNDGIITFDISDTNIHILLPQILNQKETEYLKQTISFFIKTDSIIDIEYFFVNRKEILIELANHFKTTIKSFPESKERQYLIDLLKSFDSLRGGFTIAQTDNEVLKTIAIQFTSGRDLLRYIENNEREQINNPIIYYSIWGAIYGASIIPKTLTEVIAESNTNLKTIISAFDQTIKSFNSFTDNDQITNDPIVTEKVNETSATTTKETQNENNIVAEHEPTYRQEYTALGQLILQTVETHKKVKLADIKATSKKFKTIDDIEDIIKTELNKVISLTKEGRVKFATINDNYGLFGQTTTTNR
jgi:hypothetical protein